MSLTKEQKKVRRRLKKRKGNVIFIESAPPGMKDRIAALAEKNERSMAAETVDLLSEALDRREKKAR